MVARKKNRVIFEMLSSAKVGHSDVLMRARAQNPPGPWDVGICRTPTENGHLEILQWIRWNARDCIAAARNGHLTLLKWLRLHNDPPCEWDAKDYLAAATEANANKEMIQWLKSQLDSALTESALLARGFSLGAKVDHKTLNEAYQNKLTKILEDLVDQMSKKDQRKDCARNVYL